MSGINIGRAGDRPVDGRHATGNSITAFDRRSRIDRAAKVLYAELSRAAELAGAIVPAQLAGGLTSPMDGLGDAIARVAARYAELGRAIEGP